MSRKSDTCTVENFVQLNPIDGSSHNVCVQYFGQGDPYCKDITKKSNKNNKTRSLEFCRVAPKQSMQKPFGRMYKVNQGWRRCYLSTLWCSPNGGVVVPWPNVNKQLNDSRKERRKRCHPSMKVEVVPPCDLYKCGQVTWPVEQCAVICTKKVPIPLKHQRQEQA